MHCRQSSLPATSQSSTIRAIMPTARLASEMRGKNAAHWGPTVWFCLAAIAATTSSGCAEQPSAVFTRLTEARRLTAELRVHFTKASDAANRSVMADTDEASIAFAHEATLETNAAASDLGKLEAIVHGLAYSDEVKLLAEFRRKFAKYQALDREILELAVENTNLKAQRLSFGPADGAATAFRDALDAVARSVPEKDSWHARALALTAVLSLREIQVLQAPHIAASEDAAMTALEQKIATSEANARSALKDLASMSKPELQPSIDAANAALGRFMNINAQLVALSRRNSNVRSLALSLGQKRTLAAACEASLHALSDRLAKRAFAATR
jgi:hypothetical protein